MRIMKAKITIKLKQMTFRISKKTNNANKCQFLAIRFCSRVRFTAKIILRKRKITQINKTELKSSCKYFKRQKILNKLINYLLQNQCCLA
jgi:hypothetical protein